VLPGAEGIDELDVRHFGSLFLGCCNNVFWITHGLV